MPPTLLSHAFVEALLAAREAEGRQFTNAQGQERDTLKRDLWPLLTNKQRREYNESNPGGAKKYVKWITYVIRAKLKYTRQPEKINDRFAESRVVVGGANEHTKENQQKKNQKPSTIASKDKH